MSFVLIAAVLVSFLIAFYLGKRWQIWFNFSLTGGYRIFYWVVVIFAGLLLILSRMLSGVSTYWLPLVGNIIFGLVLCSLYVLIIFDVVRWLSKKRFGSNLWTKILYVICTTSLFLFGHHMACSPDIVYYQVKIDKPANVEHLRIVHVTDTHISEVTTQGFIQQMVDDVNKLNADLIFVTGDTIDSRLKPFIEQGFDKQFQQLKSKYGTYTIFGNHEYLSISEPNNSEEDIINAFKGANMHVLKDDILYDDNLGITLIGRDDFSAERYGIARASLADLLMFTDQTSPIILLDHQPKDLDEPANLGVDLMISGHTHGGQIFPMTLVVDTIYKNVRGVYQDLDHHFTSIVSSGYGLWGPPVRLMTRSEIVVIDVTFNKPEDPFLDLTE